MMGCCMRCQLTFYYDDLSPQSITTIYCSRGGGGCAPPHATSRGALSQKRPPKIPWDKLISFYENSSLCMHNQPCPKNSWFTVKCKFEKKATNLCSYQYYPWSKLGHFHSHPPTPPALLWYLARRRYPHSVTRSFGNEFPCSPPTPEVKINSLRGRTELQPKIPLDLGKQGRTRGAWSTRQGLIG